MTENQKAHSTEFNKHVEVFTTSVSAGSFFAFFFIVNVWQVGSEVSKDGDAKTWASEVKVFPVPMGIQLVQITELLQPPFFKNALNSTFVDYFEQVLYSYCDYLQANGELDPDETCSDHWVKRLEWHQQ